MSRPKMTEMIALATAKDAANRRMRKSGRRKWNIGDWNLAVRTFNKLWPLRVK